MAKRKPKVDNRPWVSKEDVVVFDGTKESIDKIYEKAKKLGGYVDNVNYSLLLKRFLDFRLHFNLTGEDYYEVVQNTVVVFTDLAILWFGNEEKALAAVRVRTGFTRVTITFEQDDIVNEIVVPRTYCPEMTTVGADDILYEGGFQACASKYSRMTIDLGQMVGNKTGTTHYVIDRVKNPDYVVPKFGDGKA